MNPELEELSLEVEGTRKVNKHDLRRSHRLREAQDGYGRSYDELIAFAQRDIWNY